MQLKRVLAGVLTAGALSMTAAPLALAAPADGAAGAWADQVVSSTQGLRKDSSPVLALRSDSSQALGAAETTGAATDLGLIDGTFFSLGFGGTITLHFDNGITNGAGNDVQVYEATNPNYQDENVMVEASPDGSTWTTIATNIARDGGADLGNLTCVQYIRITDVTDMNGFEPTADAYDLDGVKALNTSTSACPPPVPAIDCHTFEFNDALYFKLNPNKRPGGTVNLPGNIPANVNGHSNHVNIALANAVSWNATDKQELLGWYLALQMSMYNNGGAGSGPVLGILNSPLSCWSTWGSTSFTLSNAVTIDQNTLFKDYVAEIQSAIAQNRAADYVALINSLVQISQSPY